MAFNPALSSIRDRISGSLWVWDYIYGPYYDYRVRRAGANMYGPFADAVRIDGRARVIDVGCGPGVLTCMLAEKHPDAQFVGVDYSSGQIKAASRLISRTGNGNCRFVQGDAMNLPFEDGCFDVAASTLSIKHWPEARRGLKEMYRVLADRGTGFVSEFDPQSRDDEIAEFVRRFAEGESHQRFVVYMITRFLSQGRRLENFSARTAEEAAREAGFVDVRSIRFEGLPFFQLELRK